MIKKLIVFITGRSDVWIDGQHYMKRWKFMPDWLPGFRLHKILISDQGPELHDHPFSFITFILRGGYYEYLNNGTKIWHGPGSILIRPAETMHRIELEYSHLRGYGLERPAWTFVLRSRYFREWGFLTLLGKWQHWSEFMQEKRKNK